MCSPIMKRCPVCDGETKTDLCRWCGADVEVEAVKRDDWLNNLRRQAIIEIEEYEEDRYTS